MRALAAAIPSSSGRSFRATRAAITSVSDVDLRRAPPATSSSRNSAVFVRLPLWPGGAGAPGGGANPPEGRRVAGREPLRLPRGARHDRLAASLAEQGGGVPRE